MLNTDPMSDVWWDICGKKLQSDPYFLFLKTAALFFDGSQIAAPVLCRMPHGTFISSLVLFGPVVVRGEVLKKNVNDDGKNRQVMAIAHMAQTVRWAKKTLIPSWTDRFSQKILATDISLDADRFNPVFG